MSVNKTKSVSKSVYGIATKQLKIVKGRSALRSAHTEIGKYAFVNLRSKVEQLDTYSDITHIDKRLSKYEQDKTHGHEGTFWHRVTQYIKSFFHLLLIESLILRRNLLITKLGRELLKSLSVSERATLELTCRAEALGDSINSLQSELSLLRSRTPRFFHQPFIFLILLVPLILSTIFTQAPEPKPPEPFTPSPKTDELTEVIPVQPIGMQMSELGKAAVTINVESADWLLEMRPSGSGGVWRSEGTPEHPRLWIVTNAHVLLDSLADRWIHRQLKSFKSEVIFHNDKTAHIMRFAIVDRDLDIAIVEVASRSLKAGIDYALLKPPVSPNFQQGDLVVAVGSPLGLTNTYTQGGISAFRNHTFGNRELRIIQTDASITSGNSGGPLFWRQNSDFWWVGVNTARVENENLNFAIDYREVSNISWRWFKADVNGVTEALKIYR